MTTFTLGMAAKEIGLSKPTLSKKIREGQLTAKHLDDGSYQIDGAEVARFKASYTKPPTGKRLGEAPKEKRDKSVELQITQVELVAARQRITELSADRDHLRRELTKAQERLDAAQDKLAAIAASSVARGQTPWWQRLLPSK